MDTQSPRMYRPGDTVKIGAELSDESGVQSVVARFILENDSNHDVLLRGDGEGQQRATVRLEGRVAENNAPGLYVLHYLEAHDTQGNHGILDVQPRPSFRVEKHGGDHESPNFEAWGFLD